MTNMCSKSSKYEIYILTNFHFVDWTKFVINFLYMCLIEFAPNAIVIQRRKIVLCFDIYMNIFTTTPHSTPIFLGKRKSPINFPNTRSLALKENFVEFSLRFFIQEKHLQQLINCIIVYSEAHKN